MWIFRGGPEGRQGVWCSTGEVRGASGIFGVCCAFIVRFDWKVGSVRVRFCLLVVGCR